MKEVYREARQPFNEEGGLHFSCVWKLKVIPCIPFFCGGKLIYWNRLPCRERTSCLKEFAPIVSVFFLCLRRGSGGHRPCSGEVHSS